jgi:beta-ketodecanoyl-[acyl-carrier-protein] synthase
MLVEAEDMAPAQHWEILGTKLKTQYSNNIRNNFGFLNNATGAGRPERRADKLFVQEGRKVFKEVVPMVAHDDSVDHAAHLGLEGSTAAAVAASGQSGDEPPDFAARAGA